MSALGLAIMIVAGAVTLDVVLENTRNTDASVVGQTVANVDLGGFFTAGVLVGVALMLGLMLLLAGVRRANRKRIERRELARSYEGTAAQAETLQEERDGLAAELEQERARTRPQLGDSGGHVPSGTREVGTHEVGTHEVGRDDPPIYPAEAVAPTTAPAPAPAAGTPAATATEERTKPTLKQRLLGH
ncbi:MAG TPA: hypothetical protein VLR26_09120 [Frankiaceae bacterium]|nr:hypothetical protein [Frankiaceae bacterium]